MGVGRLSKPQWWWGGGRWLALRAAVVVVVVGGESGGGVHGAGGVGRLSGPRFILKD